MSTDNEDIVAMVVWARVNHRLYASESTDEDVSKAMEKEVVAIMKLVPQLERTEASSCSL